MGTGTAKLELVLVVISFLVFLGAAQFQQSKLIQDPDCGLTTPIPGDPRTEAPWTAGIFLRQNAKKNYKFYTTGVIISPRLILSLAGGKFSANTTSSQGKSEKYSLPIPGNVVVGAGLVSTDLKQRDSNSQFMQVSHIVPFTRHESTNREFHFILYHLKKPLNTKTPFTRSACILLAGPLREGPFSLSMRQSGFTFPVTKGGGPLGFTTTRITSGGDTYCQSAFRYYYRGIGTHVFCGKAPTESNVKSVAGSCLSHGSPVLFPAEQNRWFLAGLTSLIPSRKNGSCSQDSLYIYARTTVALDWMSKNINCGSAGFACGDGTCIPWNSVCNTAPDCSEADDEDAAFCEAQNHCVEGQIMCRLDGKCIPKDQRCNKLVELSVSNTNLKGANVLSPVPVNQKYGFTEGTSGPKPGSENVSQPDPDPDHSKESACFPLPVSGGVIAECIEGETGATINCSLAGFNTKATFRCDRFYASKYRFPSVEMTCGADRKWTPYRPFACEPECGIISSNYQPLLTNGKITTKNNAFPWHAALFRRSNGGYNYICGASLIEKSFLLTAGHCVSQIRENPTAFELYKVVLAPASSNFRINMEDEIAQIFDVSQVFIPPTFNKQTLRSDISVIKLSQPVTFGGYIRPVCYLLPYFADTPQVGSLGKVSGFGIDEGGVVSETLKYANIPVVERDKCKRSIGNLPLQGSFCAGYGNGTITLCRGDSGGGITFPEARRGSGVPRYTIKGIVSSGQLSESNGCDVENFAAFTHVDWFGDWIIDILERVGQ